MMARYSGLFRRHVGRHAWNATVLRYRDFTGSRLAKLKFIKCGWPLRTSMIVEGLRSR